MGDRTGLTGWLTPFGVVWDGVEWFLGEAGGIILLPVAWLTIAGVVYGQAVKAEAPRLSGAVVTAARTRYASVPTRIRRRLGDFWQSLTAPFRSIGAALVLMWRAGAVLIASYILLFAIVEFAEQWMLVGAGRAIGPHDVASFWLPMSVGLVAAAAVLTGASTACCGLRVVPNSIVSSASQLAGTRTARATSATALRRHHPAPGTLTVPPRPPGLPRRGSAARSRPRTRARRSRRAGR